MATLDDIKEVLLKIQERLDKQAEPKAAETEKKAGGKLSALERLKDVVTGAFKGDLSSRIKSVLSVPNAWKAVIKSFQPPKDKTAVTATVSQIPRQVVQTVKGATSQAPQPPSGAAQTLLSHAVGS